MTRAARMHYQPGVGEAPHEFSGTPGVVQMNMRDEHIHDIFRRQVLFLQHFQHSGNGRCGSSLHQSSFAPVRDQVYRSQSRPQIVRIDSADAIVVIVDMGRANRRNECVRVRRRSACAFFHGV